MQIYGLFIYGHIFLCRRRCRKHGIYIFIYDTLRLVLNFLRRDFYPGITKVDGRLCHHAGYIGCDMEIKDRRYYVIRVQLVLPNHSRYHFSCCEVRGLRDPPCTHIKKSSVDARSHVGRIDLVGEIRPTGSYNSCAGF